MVPAGITLVREIEDAYLRIEDDATDVERLAVVLDETKAQILAATTMDDIVQCLTRQSSNVPRVAGMVPLQGYVGRFMFEFGNLVRYEIASAYGDGKMKPADLDEIQQAFGAQSYIAMLPVKALRAVAYMNRPETMADLTIEQYCAELGLTIGMAGDEDGAITRLTSATGFQPTDTTLLALMELSGGREHLHALGGAPDVYRASGLCDQAMAEAAIMPSSLRPETIHDIAQRTVGLSGLWH